MKKLLLSFVALTALFTGAKAQSPDFGFENWTAIAPPFINTEDPNGWASLNALTATGTAQSVYKETAAPAAGAISAKIVTVKVTGATLPNPYGGTIDTAGILAIGKISVSPPGLTYGAAYASRPAVLTFQSKYTPMTGDSAFVIAYMTHWNTSTNRRDTVATGRYATGASTTTWANNSLSMAYKPGFDAVLPDSEQVFISSSIYRSHHGAKIGSTFYIDDLVWSGYVSTNDLSGIRNSVTVYPNPATDRIAIECSVAAKTVTVMDIAGRTIGMYQMDNNKVEIQTNAMAKGVYLYNVIDAHGTILNRGKFEVSR